MADGGEPAGKASARIAGWLAAARHRPVLIASAFFLVPLLMPLSASMIAFATLLRGPQNGALSALAAAAVIGAVVLLGGGAALGVFVSALVILTLVSAAAGLLARTGSLSLTLQVCVLVAAGLAGLLGAVMPADALREVVAGALVEQLGPGAAEEAEALATMVSTLAFGLALAGLLLTVTIALLLATGLRALAQGGAHAAASFRALSLGRLVSVVAAAVLAGAWLIEGPVLANMGAVFIIAFVLQGLAVVHAFIARRAWHPLWLVLVYGLALVPTPLAPLVMVGLMTGGYLDNWLELRPAARAAPPEPRDPPDPPGQR